MLRERAKVRTTTASRQYETQLRKVAKIVGQIASTGLEKDQSTTLIERLLRAYAATLKPWATRTAWTMLSQIDTSSIQAWRSMSEEIGMALRRELDNTPTGNVMRQLLHVNVEQIQSIPLYAANRLEKLARQAVMEGGRSTSIAKAMLRTGEVSQVKAVMLARTAVSTAASTMVQARAQNIGSPGYMWETSRDGTVRKEHVAMQGVFVPWDKPPTLQNYTAHAGCYANCRCWPRPIFDLGT